MKKKTITIFSLLLSLGMITLGSCQDQISSTPDSSSSQDSSEETTSVGEGVTRRYLRITSFPDTLEYFKYQRFDSTGLVVTAITTIDGEMTESIDIDDYVMILDETGEVLTDDTVLTTTGSDVNVTISKDGYNSTSFTIGVENVNQFQQSITIDSLPKTYYYAGETFSSEGLSLSLDATFKSINSGNGTSSYELDDYLLTIDGEEAEGYILPSEPCRIEVDITATSFDDKELTASFAIFVIEKEIVGPTEYIDDSITLSEDQNSLTVHIDGKNVTAEEKASDDKGYYSPDEVSLASNLYEYSKDSYEGWKFAPASSSSGGVQKTPILVVPVVVPGYESMATEENLDIIETAFFGDSEDVYFETLHSYYYKSSEGQLDITGSVTDYFYAADESSVLNASNASSFSEYKVSTLAEECAAWASEVYDLDLEAYDSDSDGLIDAMWMIYVGPQSNYYSAYWAFSSTTQNEGNILSPEVNNYGWCGLDFITDFSHENGSHDAHVLIHETGHMFGLNDYYSYSGTTYAPLGTVDMMDNNVGDQNAYSKMMLGWTTPYIAYGECDITLDSSIHDQLIVIPYDDKTYTEDEDGKILFNPFDEYLVLEYYVPDDMNALDYDAYGVKTIKDYGLRLYHVDNRMIQRVGNTWSFYEDPDSALSFDAGVHNTCISNTETYADGYGESAYRGISEECNAYDEIRWIPQDNTYLNDSGNRAFLVDDILFKEGDSFSLEDYSAQFVDGELDCDKELTTTFTVESIVYEQA